MTGYSRKSAHMNPLEEPVKKQRLLSWPLPYAQRVADALCMLTAGSSRKDVVNRHGSVVYRQAMFEKGMSKIDPSVTLGQHK